MNRFVSAVALLLLAPALVGCSNSTFFVTAAPTPLPTPTPAPTPIAYPFDATQGTTVAGGTGKGIAMNGTTGLPTAFRVADLQDIQFGPRVAGDTANSSLLLVLQPLNPAPAAVVVAAPAAKAGGKAGATATKGAAPVAASVPAGGLLIGGVKDVNNPVRLAGVIVPGPAGAVGGGLQDPDQLALQAEASRRLVEAVSRWVHLTGTYAQPTPLPGAPAATPTATPKGLPRASLNATPTPLPPAPVDVSQSLDVFQDPKYPVDYDSRPLVQIFFKSAGGGAIKKDTSLSLNRMLIRSGLAVVDLYSPTSFDQPTWLLDEAYARHRKLGIWGMQLNGKTLSLQQRVPSPSTGTGAQSSIPVVSNVPATPGANGKLGGPITSATQSPATVTPTLAPTAFPRIITGSGTVVQRGPSNTVKLPPPSTGGSVTAPTTGNTAVSGGAGNLPSGPTGPGGAPRGAGTPGAH